MGIFDKKRKIRRKDFRDILKKERTRSYKYTKQERVKFEKELFGPKYGSLISEKEYKGVLRKLRKEKYKVKTRDERADIERKIKYLKRIGGI